MQCNMLLVFKQKCNVLNPNAPVSHSLPILPWIDMCNAFWSVNVVAFFPVQDNTLAAVTMTRGQLLGLLDLGMTRGSLVATRGACMSAMCFFGVGRGDDARDFNISDIMEPGDVNLVGKLVFRWLETKSCIVTAWLWPSHIPLVGYSPYLSIVKVLAFCALLQGLPSASAWCLCPTATRPSAQTLPSTMGSSVQSEWKLSQININDAVRAIGGWRLWCQKATVDKCKKGIQCTTCTCVKVRATQMLVAVPHPYRSMIVISQQLA